MEDLESRARYLIEHGCRNQDEVKNIFIDLSLEEQHKLLEIYISLIVNFKDKLADIRIIVGLEILFSEVRKKFVDNIILKADDETRFFLWLKGLTDVKYFEYPVKRLDYFLQCSNLKGISKIFTTITKDEDQCELLSRYFSTLGTIDFRQYFMLVRLFGVDEINAVGKECLGNLIFENGSERVKVRNWIDGHQTTMDIDFFADFMANAREMEHDTFDNIFNRLHDVTDQIKLLDTFLKKIDDINTEDAYIRIEAIISVANIHEVLANFFLPKVIEMFNEKYKSKLISAGHTLDDYDLLSYKLLQKDFCKQSGKIIFLRIKDPQKQKELLAKITENLKNNFTLAAYSCFCNIVRFKEINLEVREEFINDVFENSDSYYRFKMWEDHITSKKDLKSIFFKLTSLNNINKEFLKSVISRLDSPDDQKQLFQYFLEWRKPIDSDYKLNDVLSILTTEGIHPEALNEFLINVYENSDQQRKEDIVIKVKIANPLEKELATKYLDSFDLIDLFPVLTRFLLNKEKQVAKTYSRIVNTKFVNSYIELNINRIETEFKTFIEKADYELIHKFLTSYHQWQINLEKSNRDLEIAGSNNSLNFDEFLIEKLNDEELLHLWLQDLTGYFDYSKYCTYYYSLPVLDRKLFIRKIKAKMGSEFKEDLLKMKEPWTFIESRFDEQYGNISVYSATWKSIWFFDGSIKICKSTNFEFTDAFETESSRKELNFLHHYISKRRMNPLIVYVLEKRIVKIDGLADLEEAILIVDFYKEIETGGLSKEGDRERIFRIPNNILIRNKNLNFLVSLQNESRINLILEKTYNTTTKKVSEDVTFLFSIDIDENQIALLWEGARWESSKATFIFKSLRSNYEVIIDELKNYLENTPKVRSNLISNDIEILPEKQRFQYIGRVYHDNFNEYKWEEEIYNLFPVLRQRNQSLSNSV